MGDGGSGSTQEPMVKYIYGIYWFDVALFFLDDLRFLDLNGKNNFNLVRQASQVWSLPTWQGMGY